MLQALKYIYIFTAVFIVVFTIIYPTLTYAAKDLIKKKFIVANGFFLFSLAVVSLIYITQLNWMFAAEFGMLFIAFNIYLLLLKRIKNLKFFLMVILEILLVFGLFLSVFVVLARMHNYPLLHIIGERFSDNSYSFIPGHYEEIILCAFATSFMVVAVKNIWYYYILFKINKLQQWEIRKAQLQNDFVQTKLDALQAKVNPHFLYNSLNSIAGLALVDGEKTRQMALALSRFFRYGMNREHTNLISLANELEMIKTYLEIEKIRFGDKITYTILADNDTLTTCVPRMLLQPLVENSVKHGLKGECSEISISVCARLKDKSLIISVADNGTPFASDFVLGYGFKSIYDKLDLLFPDHYQVEILRGENKEVRIEIYNPVNKVTTESEE